MDWLKRKWVELAVTAVVELAVVWAAGTIFGGAAKNEYIHDIGLLVIWVVTLLLAFLFLTRDRWAHFLEPARQARERVQGGNTEPGVRAETQGEIISSLFQLDFSGLFAKTEQYIEAIFYVSQTWGSPVTLTGVEGRMRIGDEECSLLPWLVNGPRTLARSGRAERYDCRIRQPLRTQMVQELRMGLSGMNLYSVDGRARITFSRMSWLGSIAQPEGERPLPDCPVSYENVLVKGPIREDTADKVLWRGQPVFMSQTYYDLADGAQRVPEGHGK